jgi:hypothetical protein
LLDQKKKQKKSSRSYLKSLKSQLNHKKKPKLAIAQTWADFSNDLIIDFLTAF